MPHSAIYRRICDLRKSNFRVCAEFRVFARGRPLAASAVMAGFKDFREIVAWQLAREMRLLADALLAKPEVKRRFKYHDQLRDAARSGPRNIAEGFGRFFHKPFANHVRIAKGSENEVLDHFIDARDQGWLTDEEFKDHERMSRRAMGAAAGLIRYLESTPDPPAPKYLPKLNAADPDFGQE